MNIFRKKVLSILGALIIITGLVFVFPRPVFAVGGFLGGDIMTATNNTSGNGSWSDPVNAISGEVIEFRIVAQNQNPSATAHNVKVSANLPSTPAHTLTASGTVSADDMDSISDTVTVNVTDGKLQAFAYIPGHVRIFSTSCPSGCSGPDTVASGGVTVGDLTPGQSAQVLFKAYVTNFAQPTTAPTTAPTVAPTATPPSSTPQSCQAGQVMVGHDQAGAIICQTINVSSNSSSSSNATGGSVTITNPTAAPVAAVVTPAAVSQPSELKELPKTGLPVAAWGLSGLLPLGYKLRRFGKLKGTEVDDPASLWMDKQIKRS